MADVFAQTQGRQKVAQQLLMLQRQVRVQRRQFIVDHAVRDAIVTVDARQFLDQVGLAGDGFAADVEAVLRHRHLQPILPHVDREFESAQDGGGFLRREFHAHDALDLGDGECDLHRLRRQGIVVEDAGGDRTAAVAAHQFDAAPDPLRGDCRVDAATEANAGVGDDLLRLHRAADVDGVPVGGLEQHVARVVVDLRLGTADDATQAKDTG